MKDTKLVLRIKEYDDLKKIDKNIKYIKLDLNNPNEKIISYLLENGQKLLYTSIIDSYNGYIYVDYETFKTGQLIIENIIKSIPINLNDIEKTKYLYIKLGMFIGYDINTIPEKNEIINLKNSNTINNIWGAITRRKITNKTITELLCYLCKLANIECKIVIINEYGYRKNIITTNNKEIIVDLNQDIPYIQSGFKTRFFGIYNDNEELDKKIGYLKNKYGEKELENALKDLDYSKEDFFKQILLKSQDAINVYDLGPIELGIIYNNIFNKYCPDQEISINNLYINNKEEKEHFILITHEGKHYSFNYNQNTFVEIKEEELEQNINNRRIGIYEEEKIPIKNKSGLKVA